VEFNFFEISTTNEEDGKESLTPSKEVRKK